MTGRARVFLIAALVFWMFANQTQVNWLYVISALIVGIVAVSFVLNRGSLRGISGRRTLNDGRDFDLHEDDEVHVHLTLSNRQRAPKAHLDLLETCPLAAPESEVYQQNVFVPALPGRGEVAFSYATVVDRRGVHVFPPLDMTSYAPFSLFRRRRRLDVPTRALVLPVVKPLRRFSLLDRQPAAQMTFPRAGMGTEVIGVRPYQPGDSPRAIHWRSVARTGQLVSKEFAEEVQPGLTLVLDRYQPAAYQPQGKHSPFEWAIKSAASIADYAIKRGYPLYLAADYHEWPPPQGALSMGGLLQYLARVESRPQTMLPDLLGYHVHQSFAAVLISWPDMAYAEALAELKRRGVNVLAVLPDPASFPQPGLDARPLADELRRLDIEVRLLRFGQPWDEQINQDLLETHRSA